jgi:hypothetical protein
VIEQNLEHAWRSGQVDMAIVYGDPDMPRAASA